MVGSRRALGRQLKVAVSVRGVVRLLIVQIRPVPSTLGHPCHPPNVPAGTAVNIIAEPLAKPLLTQGLEALVQSRPGGELVTDPEPPPTTFRVTVGPVPPPGPVKQTTLPVIEAVMMAPEDDRPPELLPVFTVAETRELPQAMPVAVSTPEESTVTI